MRPSDPLRERAAADREAATRHPFAELADGSPPPARIAYGLPRQRLVPDGVMRLVAAAIATARNVADAAPDARFLGDVTGPETTCLRQAFEALGMDEAERAATVANDPAAGLRALAAEAAASGRHACILAVPVVAEWRSRDRAAPHAPPAWELSVVDAERIALRSGESFEAPVEHLRGQLGRARAGLDAAERAELARFFAWATAPEVAFVDAAMSVPGR